MRLPEEGRVFAEIDSLGVRLEADAAEHLVCVREEIATLSLE